MSSPSRRLVLLAIGRPALTVAVLIVAYYVLPVDRAVTGWTVVLLVAELGVVVALVVWQTRVILRSRYPGLQGVQALALTIPLFLLVYANVYYLVGHHLAGSFTEQLTRTDALYFAVTVFATVGFGDIAPVSETARILVTTQMVGDLLVLGVALRVILEAVRRRRAA